MSKKKPKGIIGTPTLNGKPINITDSWDKTTFSQFLRIIKYQLVPKKDRDYIELISIITGLEYEHLKKAEIKGFDKLLYAAEFINHEAKFNPTVTHIGKFKLPLNSKGVFDIQFESLAQFEDMRKVFEGLKDGIYHFTEAYATYCAIYCQKLKDGVYDGDKAMAMVPECMNLPASEIVSAGSFFFLKLRNLLSGINPNSQNTSPKQGKNIGKRTKKRSVSRQR